MYYRICFYWKKGSKLGGGINNDENDWDALFDARGVLTVCGASGDTPGTARA